MSFRQFALALLVLISVGVAAWPSGTQRSQAGGVTVSVTAGNLEPDAGMWDFAVSLDTRPGRRLDDDLMTSAVMVTPDGRQMRPLAWEGSPAGASHRAGVLKFIAMKPRPKSMELRITRPGEARPRVFRFQFGEWVARGP